MEQQPSQMLKQELHLSHGTPTVENLYRACHNNCLETVNIYANNGHYEQLSKSQRRTLAATSVDIAQIFLLHGLITSSDKYYIDTAKRLVDTSNNNSKDKFS